MARVGWLAAPVLGALLAGRIAERAGAGRGERAIAAALAAAAIVLLADGLTPWLRQFAGGLAEPVMVALVLAAVERGLAGREGAALALGAAAALVRPEVWPALLVYGGWLWSARPERRPAVATAIAGIAALWFVPDLLGSGSLFTGADRAREGSGSPPVEALEVIGRAAVLPLAALWLGFAGCAVAARRRGDRALLIVAAGALAWVALVAVMAAGGYAGLPRFLAPAAAVACALGAAGLARLGTRARDPGAPRALVAITAVLVLALAVQAGFRVAALPGDARSATAISAAREQLELAVDEVGAGTISDCGEPVVGAIEGQTALAWLLDVPIGEVDVSKTPPSRGVFFERTDGGWTARSVACDAES
ncbi:MAG TPA: hypothetical protein VFY99_05945 [Solirubrobacterales bacterium]